MTLYTIDPLTDSRWTSFLERHAEATISHTPGWLRALQRTYGYKPVVYSTSRPDEELTNGMVFCEVNSWLTGRRLVSLPFSDHCQPLLSRPEELWVLLNALAERRERERWRYIEIRPLHPAPVPIKEHTRFGESEEFYLHKVDLTPLLSEVYRGFHESCVQRKIRKAERANLSYEEGRSAMLLEKFYRLLVMTRRRHLVPPQPIEWFRNLIKCLGEQIKIRLVSQKEQLIASIITLTYKDIVVYKYGCSDLNYNNFGGMPLLLWETIQEAKSLGAQEVDLGRSEPSNTGLVTFKEHWGATRSALHYFRYPFVQEECRAESWRQRVVKTVYDRAPDSVLVLAGQLLYKHVA